MPLEAAHLILVQDTPLSIRFRPDERRFDVDGAYDIRHEIIKKRIDKARIKGSSERLTQPGKIAIVYSHGREMREYMKYIDYLQAENYLEKEIEKLELQNLQGVYGLQACGWRLIWPPQERGRLWRRNPSNKVLNHFDYHKQTPHFIPTTRKEISDLGWDALDVILVTGDTYVDSPLMGVAVIGRVLMNKGYRVGIIAQPDVREGGDITRLGSPKLFWGVTAGAVDSLVANYTASGKRRKRDDLTPGGINDRASRSGCHYLQQSHSPAFQGPAIYCPRGD